MPPGAMLSVPLAAESVQTLGLSVDIAAVNGPQLTAVSGTDSHISELEQEKQTLHEYISQGR